MAYCTKCGAQLPDAAAFCPSCGAKNGYQPVQQPVYEQPPVEVPPVVEAQPVYEQPIAEAQPIYDQPPVQEPVYQEPVYQQPVYQQPVYQQPAYSYQQPVAQAQPEVSVGSKVMGFIGMGLGITALVFAVLDLLMSFSGLVALGSYGSEEIGAAVLVYAIFTIIFAIPGKILSAKASAGGFAGTPIKLGNVFSLIGIIMGAVTFFIGILCIAS